ncbi:MAG: hypothetical protein IK085_10225, partial [Clostridia bacterium]|nr:hypothetical protein [Clostridia bacterium]
MLNAKGNPIEYVRYKRSTGMSRVGKCYFIRKEMYKKMVAWSDFSPGSSKIDANLKEFGLTLISDPVAHEAYTALTLSTIEDTIEIPLDSILFMRDVEGFSTPDAINVKCEEGKVVAKRERVNISSILWDGEALLDESVFEQAGRSSKGMMLLRNRYFKSCAFNTRLQEWFNTSKIKEVSQLNGFTLATDISQVKMVVTESSLKFLKMFEGEFEDKIRYWAEHIKNSGGNLFGIVKSEKPTKFAGGQYVRTSYQLINTINITEEEAKTLVAPVNEFKRNLRADYRYMKYYLDEFRSDDSDTGFNPLLYKKKLVSAILSKYPEFAETKMYYGFRNDIIREINNSVKDGKLLVRGTNAVLFGNGLDLLFSSGFKDYHPWRLFIDDPDYISVYSSFFKERVRILCVRSPHITMGNIIVADSIKEEYDHYFNLTDNIICVNAIGSTVQHRLNGCDYDSDVMLISDNNVLSQAALRDYGSFPVPFNGIEFDKSKNKSLAEIDRLISENKIGEIVNLSQKLNTIYWSIINTPDISIISPE